MHAEIHCISCVILNCFPKSVHISYIHLDHLHDIFTNIKLKLNYKSYIKIHGCVLLAKEYTNNSPISTKSTQYLTYQL